MAVNTPNMALHKWNVASDPFSYTDLAANWDLVDIHDHTTGKGVQIPTNGIANAAVTNAKLGNLAVDNGKIATGAVTAAKVANDTLSYTQMAKDSSAPAAGCFSAYRSTAGTTATNGATIIFDAVEWDLSGWYSTTTGRFTPQVKGVYYLISTVQLTGTVTTGISLDIQKNGTLTRGGPVISNIQAGSSTAYGLVDANGTTDFFSIFFNHSGQPAQTLQASAPRTFFQGYLVAKRT
jgi:hypothetical protein